MYYQNHLEHIKTAAFIDELRQSDDGIKIGLALGILKQSYDQQAYDDKFKRFIQTKPVASAKPITAAKPPTEQLSSMIDPGDDFESEDQFSSSVKFASILTRFGNLLTGAALKQPSKPTSIAKATSIKTSPGNSIKSITVIA